MFKIITKKQLLHGSSGPSAAVRKAVKLLSFPFQTNKQTNNLGKQLAGNPF